MRISLPKLARAAALLAVTTSNLCAHAAGAPDAYAGVALGPSSIDADCSSIVVSSCDTGDTGFKLYVGFDLPHLPLPKAAFEVAYIDFGQAVVSTPLTQRTVEASAVAFDLALHGQLASSVSITGRAGLAYVSAKGNGIDGHHSGSNSSSNLEPHLGASIEFALNRQFKLMGGFDYTQFDTGAESGAAHLVSIGVQMGF